MARYFMAGDELIVAVACNDNGAQVLECTGYVECTQEEYELLLELFQKKGIGDAYIEVRDIHGD